MLIVSAPHSTKFVPSSSSSKPSVSEIVSETVKPPVIEIVKPIEISPSKKIRVDLKESKLKESTLTKDKLHGKPLGFVIFVESLGTFIQTVTSCKLLREQINQKCLRLKHKILWYLLVNW